MSNVKGMHMPDMPGTKGILGNSVKGFRDDKIIPPDNIVKEDSDMKKDKIMDKKSANNFSKKGIPDSELERMKNGSESGRAKGGLELEKNKSVSVSERSEIGLESETVKSGSEAGRAKSGKSKSSSKGDKENVGDIDSKSSKGKSKKEKSDYKPGEDVDDDVIPFPDDPATNKKLPRPHPPVVGKVTHFSILLYWDNDLEAAMNNRVKEDGRVRVCLQELDKSGEWGNVYSGYAKQHTVSGLDPQSEYRYRMRFMNSAGHGDWSAQVKVSTTKEPMNGEHLHRALARQDLELLEKIIESGDVNIDVPDKFGFSALMQASIKGYTEIAEILLKHGADVHLQNDAGKTALMFACYAGNLDVVKLLRQHGARYTDFDRGGTAPIHWAVDGGNDKLMQWLIADGADVNLKDLNSGWTPLIRCASVSGHRDVAVTLLQNGADINVQDKDGKTPCMLAVLNNHQALLEVLLKKRADLTKKNEYGKTAYDMAVSMEKRRMVKVLSDHMEEHRIKISY